MILGLPWQSNYKIGCDWNREGKHFISIKGQFLAHSINQDAIRQLAKTNGQYTIQNKSITWIMVKSPLHINNNNSIHEIQFNRKLPPGIIPLDITHNLNHKYPSKFLTPLLSISNKEVKIPKNTNLGSINPINDVDDIQEVSWQKIQDTKEEAVKNTVQNQQFHKLLPVFPKNSNFQIPTNDSSKPAVMLQDAEIPQAARDKLNLMINNQFTCIISNSSADFGSTNLVEMDLPTTGLPGASKPYTIPLKCVICRWRNKIPRRCRLDFEINQQLGITHLHSEEKMRFQPT